jgi:hypothetical protein
MVNDELKTLPKSFGFTEKED